MSAQKNGGPAFAAMNESCGQDGMSLRDYFAAAALQGGIAAPGFGKESNMESIAERVRAR